MGWGEGLLAKQRPSMGSGIPSMLSLHVPSVPSGKGTHHPRANSTPSPRTQLGHGSHCQSTRLQRFPSRWRLVCPRRWVRRASRSNGGATIPH